VKDGAFILCLIKSSFYTVKQYTVHRIIAYRAFLQSQRFVVVDVLIFDVLSFDVLSFDVLSFDVLYVHPLSMGPNLAL
jgi:hypothetical protein